MVERAIKHVKRDDFVSVLKIQTSALKAMHDYMYEKELVQLMPVMLSTVTDPLNHPVYDSSIMYGGKKLELTKSMILHKQMALMHDRIKGLYIVSPNIRLEMEDTGKSGRHLLEFSQVDVELKEAKMKDFIEFAEEMYIRIISSVKKDCEKELKELGRELKIPKRPFPIFDSIELKEKYGKDFEAEKSKEMDSIFWITNHEREFYDKKDEEGQYVNYDIVYPEGFGEALSGGEREHEYEKILKKMEDTKVSHESYSPYVEIAKRGLLKPSSGGGFGVERLVRYLTGKRHIREVTLFPRVPGEEIIV